MPGSRFFDAFTDADGTLLPDHNSRWTNDNGSVWDISSNAAHIVSGPFIRVATVVTDSDAYRVSARFNTAGIGGNYFGLSFKHNSGGQFFYLRVSTGNVDLYQYTGGGATGHTFIAPLLVETTDGNVYGVETIAGTGSSQFILYRNGVSVFTVIYVIPAGWDDALVGIVGSDIFGTIDDFEVISLDFIAPAPWTVGIVP